MTINILFIFLLTIGASFIQRTVGFGFGIFIMTMLPYLMPSYGEATTLSGLLALTTSAVIAWKMRRVAEWRKLVLILATFTLVSALCICWLKRIDDRVMREILGVVLVLIGIYFAWMSRRIKIPTSWPYQIGAGTLSGFLGGFFGMQGPPAVLYFISASKDKEHYMALAQTYFLCGNILMTGVRAWNGFLTPAVGRGYLYGLGGAAIGTSLGAFVFRHIPNRIFRYIVYAYICLAGVIIFVTSVS